MFGSHLRFLPVILTCFTGTKTEKTVLWLLYFLIGVKWHGRGRRFDPGQVHQFLPLLISQLPPQTKPASSDSYWYEKVKLSRYTLYESCL